MKELEEILNSIKEIYEPGTKRDRICQRVILGWNAALKEAAESSTKDLNLLTKLSVKQSILSLKIDKP
jgi:hypothetical protein